MDFLVFCKQSFPLSFRAQSRNPETIPISTRVLGHPGGIAKIISPILICNLVFFEYTDVVITIGMSIRSSVGAWLVGPFFIKKALSSSPPGWEKPPRWEKTLLLKFPIQAQNTFQILRFFSIASIRPNFPRGDQSMLMSIMGDIMDRRSEILLIHKLFGMKPLLKKLQALFLHLIALFEVSDITH